MKKLTLSLLLLFTLLCSSCAITIQKHVRDLTLYKKFNGDTHGLRTDGVYLGENIGSDGKPYWHVQVLYKDGTVYGGSSEVVRSVEEITKRPFYDITPEFKKLRYLWGVFNIDANKNITVQNVGYVNTLNYHVVELSGRILSDTSYVITSQEYYERSEEDYVERKSNTLYKFYPLQRKPDSTNWMMTNKFLNRRRL